MTIQQLEYILAVDQFRHFARAAEYCRVTQPTLSAMIQKLEDELGVKLFDRTVQPVCPTPIGQKVIDQARVILAQINSHCQAYSAWGYYLLSLPICFLAFFLN